MDFFAVKKMVSLFLTPIPIILALLTLALVGAWWSKANAWVRWPLLGGWLLLTVLSLYPISSSWLMRYEGLYPAYQPKDFRPVENIVVLACYAIEDPLLPISSQIHPCSRGRLIEAMRIWRLHPKAQILLSGGSMRFQQSSLAQLSANLLMALGVPEENLRVIEAGRDTNSEVMAIKPLLTRTTPVLVTSATHMKRAVRLFARHGISVNPAPAEHLIFAPSSDELYWRSWVPHSYNLYRSERAWYASLGNTLVTLQGLWSGDEEAPQEPGNQPEEQLEAQSEPDLIPKQKEAPAATEPEPSLEN